ncbi:MAG: nucleotide exchange factor GrpE [Haloarculaceae archaeon]
MSEQDAADAEESPAEAGTDADAADAAAAAVDEPIDEELVERVAETEPEDLAREIAGLRVEIDALEAELEEREAELEERDSDIEDLESKLKRTQADFQNYKKRMEKRREEERQRATEDLIERLLDVRDNLARALDQEEGTDIRGGVESTLQQFDDELARENVERVEPGPGADVDPHRHEVLVRVASDQPEGTVADVHRPGYEMAGKVIRTAQVTVSEGPEAADGEAEAGDDEAGDDETGDSEEAASGVESGDDVDEP